jgi:hypothetical protein
MVYTSVVSMCDEVHDRSPAYLCIAKTFEERSDTDEADVVVPHHRPLLVITTNFEGILEDYNKLASNYVNGMHDIPSKLSLPVFVKKSFLSELYGIWRGYAEMPVLGKILKSFRCLAMSALRVSCGGKLTVPTTSPRSNFGASLVCLPFDLRAVSSGT